MLLRRQGLRTPRGSWARGPGLLVGAAIRVKFNGALSAVATETAGLLAVGERRLGLGRLYGLGAAFASALLVSPDRWRRWRATLEGFAIEYEHVYSFDYG